MVRGYNVTILQVPYCKCHRESEGQSPDYEPMAGNSLTTDVTAVGLATHASCRAWTRVLIDEKKTTPARHTMTESQRANDSIEQKIKPRK